MIKNLKRNVSVSRKYVYVIHRGCIYEGGSMGPVFKNRQKARKYLLKEVALEQNELEASRQWMIEEHGSLGSIYSVDWHETHPDCFQSEFDYIKIIKSKVL